MAKKKKYPYKYIRPEQLDEYKDMGRENLIDSIMEKNAQLETCVSAKKNNGYLKELGKEISEFRKEHSTQELIDLEQELKEQKESRDEEIEDSIGEKKDIEGGLNDAINANKEHISILLSSA